MYRTRLTLDILFIKPFNIFHQDLNFCITKVASPKLHPSDQQEPKPAAAFCNRILLLLRRPTHIGVNESVAKNSKLFFISLQSKLDDDPEELEDFDDDEETKSNSKQTAVKKGLLWQQRDKLFSQWKERYFILTPDYLQCFKKGSSRMTEMGEFIFKVCYK